MKRISKYAGIGAAAGCLLVTLFAVGEMSGSPDAPAMPVRIILALAMGGLLIGAPVGAILGGLAGALRRQGRFETGAPTPAPAAGGGAPLFYRPAQPRPQSRPQQAAGPAPLAPISEAPPAHPAPVVDRTDPQRLNRVLAELDSMPGMEKVAEQMRRMARRVMLDQQRRAQGLKTAETSYHAVFVGPPGTGKTSVARIWGRALAAMGALPSGHVVETDRSGLVGQHVGSTAIQTAERFDEARGGVLFIDEAYMLTPPNHQMTNDFGREAVDSLLTRMTNDRATTAVVAAGYTDEMERFLDSNPGLRRRFTHALVFDDYDAPTLLRIAQSMAWKSDYEWDEGSQLLLANAFTRLTAAPPKGWGNAGSVEAILSAAIDAQAERLAQAGYGSADISTLSEADASAALQRLYPQAV